LTVAVCFIVLLLALHGREYRYILPVMPLLAIAAGNVLASCKPRWKVLLAVLVAGQVAWSLFLTDHYAWRNWGEIMLPF
jgi:hypothetical protein